VQHIVIDIADPNETRQSALEAAKSMIQPGDRVFLFHNVFHPNFINAGQHPDDDVLGEAQQLLVSAREERLKLLADELTDTRTATQVMWSDNGWQTLLQFATEKDATLIIAQSDRPSRWRPLARANEDWQLIRHCPVPLLLTRAECTHDYRRILAAVDPLHVDDKPAELDKRILQHAAAMARLHNASLCVLNVAAPVAAAAPGATVPAMTTEPMQQHLVEAHEARLAALVEDLDCEITECCVVPGVPAQEIVAQAAARDIDLVVMGAISRSILRNFLIGNTAEKVLDQLTADTLIIKPAVAPQRLFRGRGTGNVSTTDTTPPVVVPPAHG